MPASRKRSAKRVAPPQALLGERVHGDVQGDRAKAWDVVYRLVRRIPRGRVMTYGQIATLIENRLSARAVGWAMHGCPEGVPWQRVVNASGGCSTDRLPEVPEGLQRALLEGEGVEFRDNGTLDLEVYRWQPRRPPALPPRTAARRRRKPATRT
jgi:methylated-DNA-protein-cysteine methyltransferase-like protein